MITRLNVASIYVLDKDEALDFYVNKLGLEVAQDFKQGPVRWLTVRVPGDPDTEIYLEEPGPPALARDEEARATQDLDLRSPSNASGVARLLRLLPRLPLAQADRRRDHRRPVQRAGSREASR